DAGDAARPARAIDDALVMVDDLEIWEGAQQLALLEQVVRVEAAAELIDVRPPERLVEQQSARRERALERPEELALQVVQRDDHVVRACRQRLVLEVDDARCDRQRQPALLD